LLVWWSAGLWTKPMVLLCSSFCYHDDVISRLGSNPLNRNPKIRLRQKSNNILEDEKWKGEIVSEGTIRGCSVTPVVRSDVSTSTVTTEWIITIDGVEADLGRFSEAIYKQIVQQAKRERFQGFRPGTIPPHLMRTYLAYCMDECARETVLEAMQQNNIRPFSDARSQFVIEQVSIPPLSNARNAKSKSKNSISDKKKKPPRGGQNIPIEGTLTEVAGQQEEAKERKETEEEALPSLQWRYFDTMDGAIQGGWKPGQSFSFVAKNVKGQNVLPKKDIDGAQPIGRQW
jgi:hypothetical protein